MNFPVQHGFILIQYLQVTFVDIDYFITLKSTHEKALSIDYSTFHRLFSFSRSVAGSH